MSIQLLYIEIFYAILLGVCCKLRSPMRLNCYDIYNTVYCDLRFCLIGSRCAFLVSLLVGSVFRLTILIIWKTRESVANLIGLQKNSLISFVLMFLLLNISVPSPHPPTISYKRKLRFFTDSRPHEQQPSPFPLIPLFPLLNLPLILLLTYTLIPIIFISKTTCPLSIRSTTVGL